MISRKRAGGIVVAIVLWTIATGYLAYRVLIPPKPAIDPSSIIAKFDSNVWGLIQDPTTGERRSAVIDVVVTNLGPQARNYRIMGITRVADNTVDINVDTRINRSTEFTIVAGTTRIEIPFSMGDQQRLRAGGGVDFMVIALPNEYGANQVATLSTLQSLRGQIVIHHAIGVPPKNAKLAPNVRQPSTSPSVHR